MQAQGKYAVGALLVAMLCVWAAPPRGVRMYAPTQSETYVSVTQERFSINFEDDTILKGFTSRDVVQLGSFHVTTRFGCITDVNNDKFNHVDGILGFGLPNPKTMNNLPLPLLFALSDPDKDKPPSAHGLPVRQFSFMAGDNMAELQLGGFDPKAITGEMFFLPINSKTEYSVPVTSIKYGDLEVLEFSTERRQQVDGILDSGTSCLVLPNSTFGGLLTSSPYQRLITNSQDADQKKLPLVITIGGHKVDIPFEDWYATFAGVPCVQSTPSTGFMKVIIGDVLFRSWLIMFDLTSPSMPVVGFARQNKQYVPGTHHPTVHKLPALKQEAQVKTKLLPQTADIDHVPLTTVKNLQYLVNVSIGTPRQNFTVYFDTGSSSFCVFSRPPTDDFFLGVPGFYTQKGYFYQVKQWSSSAYGSTGGVIPLLALVAAAMMVALAAQSRRKRVALAAGPATPSYGTFGWCVDSR